MSTDEYDHILSGIEPYRDPFQILTTADPDSDEYEEARRGIYNLMLQDDDVGGVDRMRVARVLDDNPEKAYEKLERVLEP